MSDITPEDHPVLDWRKSLDSRNGNYLLRSVLPPEGVSAKQVLWRRPYRHLDQGRVGACTMFATTIARMHVGPAGQRTWRPTPNTDDAGNAFALKWFHRAQELDEFASTPPEDGSSVNGAARAGEEAGIYKAHYWAESVDDIKASLRVHGSGVFGSSWPSGSFRYDEHFVVPHTGGSAGGHARCFNGYIPDYYGRPVFRGMMSWGMWGDAGIFYEPEDKVRELWEDGAEYAWLVPA